MCIRCVYYTVMMFFLQEELTLQCLFAPSDGSHHIQVPVIDLMIQGSIRFYCHGAVGMTREWLLTDNITPAATVVEMMFASMPENLRQIYFT